MSLSEELRRLDEQITRQRQVQENVVKGREALQNGNFPAAKTFFKEALRVDENTSEAQTGLIEAFLTAGNQAQQKRQWREAQSQYQSLLAMYPDNEEARARLDVVNRQVWTFRVLSWGGGLLLVTLLFAQFGNFIRWPQSVCSTQGVGGVLCTPTPTPTLPPPTPTVTPLPPTATPTLTPTPTPTLTPTLEPTPTPVRGQLIRDRVAVYPSPETTDPNQIIALLPQGTQLFLCAKEGRRYQVALGPCFQTTPLGWITETNIQPTLEDLLATPTPLTP